MRPWTRALLDLLLEEAACNGVALIPDVLETETICLDFCALRYELLISGPGPAAPSSLTPALSRPVIGHR